MKKIATTLLLLVGLLLPTNAIASPPEYSCPEGSSLTSDLQCLPDMPTATASNLSTNYLCPDGYILADSLCTKSASAYTATVTTSYSCPSGGTLSGSTCTVAGYYLGSNSYNASLSTSNYCPSGGYLSGSYCITREAVAGDWYYPSSSYSCPSGGTLSGSTCLKTVLTYTYSSGCTYSGSMYSCPANYSASVSYASCSSGYYSFGGYCQKDAISELSYGASTSYNYSCPSGGTLSGSTCTVEGAYIQPTSYNASSSSSYSCPSGGTLSDGLCTSSLTTIPSATYTGDCPNHYDLNTITGYCEAKPFTATIKINFVKYSCYSVYGGATWISPYDNTFDGYVYCSINSDIAENAEGEYFCNAYDLANGEVTAYITDKDDSYYLPEKRAIVCDFRPFVDYQQDNLLESTTPLNYSTPCDQLTDFSSYYACAASEYN